MYWLVHFIWLLIFTKYWHIKQVFLSPIEDGKEYKEKDDKIIKKSLNRVEVSASVNNFLIAAVTSDFEKI